MPDDSKPHKCPVCDGWGERHILSRVSTTDPTPAKICCSACGGTGVIWTPIETGLYAVPSDWPMSKVLEVAAKQKGVLKPRGPKGSKFEEKSDV